MTHTTPQQFKEDVKHASKMEYHFIDILKKNGYSFVEKSEEGNSYYDIKSIKNGKTLTFELKEDMQTATTGNIAIEVSKEINGITMPSCLSITTSDIYIMKISKGKFFKYYFIETKKLRMFINNKNFEIIKGGDKNRSNLVLIPEKLFYEQCDLEKTITFENPAIKNTCNKIRELLKNIN